MGQIEFSLVYNRKKSLNKNGEALIQICCYRMGVRKYFSTGIYVKPEEWNERKQIVNHFRDNYDEVNERLEEKIFELKTKIKLIKEKGETATLKKLKEVKDEKIYYSFYDFMEDQIVTELIPKKQCFFHNYMISYISFLIQKFYLVHSTSKYIYDSCNILKSIP